MAKVKIIENKNNNSLLNNKNEYTFSINTSHINSQKLNSKIRINDYSYVIFDLKYTFFISILLLATEIVIFILTKSKIINIPSI